MMRIVKSLAVLAALSSPALAESPRTIIVMDGSGSMWGQIDGRAKLEIARETVAKVLGAIPADQELGMMAYGHREKGNCGDIELVVAPAPGTGPEIAAQVDKMRFLGKTPLSEAVRQAAEALRYGEEAATVVLVTDGIETCDADPCALGRELEAAGLNFTAHVIGFGLTEAEGAKVACLATETGGRYLQASDAGALSDALAATVTAKLPPPQPAPEPEPEPVLPKATLTAPASAPAGSVVRVAFEGPHEEFDYIRILDAEGKSRSEAAVSNEPFVDIRLPFAIGAYEVIYSYKSVEVIAQKPLAVTEAVVSLTAPDSAPAGSAITIEWSGPAAEYDYINLVNAAGERVAEAKVGDASPASLRLPFKTGNFTLNYMFQSNDIIFSRPIILTESPISISVPEKSQVGSDVIVTWEGPNAEYDNIQLYRKADEERISYQYLGDTNQLTFTMPEEPGIYEFRYQFQDSEAIYARPITVTLD
jgi:Ca-activated chloride channel family protein